MIENTLFIRAINNETQALMELGKIYLSGSEGEENKEKAVIFFGKAVENALKKAEKSDMTELKTVICCLEEYFCGEDEKTETVFKETGIKDIFSSSKRTTNADSKTDIIKSRAESFRNEGKKKFENKEYEEAELCFKKAVENDDIEAVSLLIDTKIKLAYKSYYGTDSDPDFLKSEKYFREVAESGDERFTVEAKMCLAELYSTRLDRKEEAVEIWQELASNGNADAQYNYGLALFNGMGIERDEERGVYWWQKAAQNGHADAKYNVDVFFSNI